MTTLEETSRLPISGELRDARERAVGALLAAGATVRSVRLTSWRGAVLPFLATLQAASGVDSGRATIDLLEQAGETPPSWRRLLRAGALHTAPTRVTLAAELLPDAGDSRAQRRLVATGESIAAELIEAIGEGVLLHPAHPRVAPKHRRTYGRPWLLTPAAVFNLAGVPVTEVPLGRSESGLPLGVQVAAGPGRDHLSIGVALELERVFGGWTPPRAAP